MIYTVLVFISLLALVPAAFVGRWIWRKGLVARGTLVALLSLASWQLFEAVYPDDSFYISEAKRIVDLKIPGSAKLIYKTASFPDHFGDYSACIVLELTSPTTKQFQFDLGTTFQTENEFDSCGTLRPGIKVAGLSYDLSNRATRSDVQFYVSAYPSIGKFQVSWGLW